MNFNKFKPKEKKEALLNLVHEATNLKLPHIQYCKQQGIKVSQIEYLYRKYLCPTRDIGHYNKMLGHYIEIIGHESNPYEYCKNNNIQYASFQTYWTHFDQINETAKYIKDNNLNIQFQPHVVDAFELLSNEKYKFEHKENKVTENNEELSSKKIGFNEIQQVPNEPKEETVEPEYHPANDIEITGKYGLKVSIPVSVSSEKVFKIIEFIRSL